MGYSPRVTQSQTEPKCLSTHAHIGLLLLFIFIDEDIEASLSSFLSLQLINYRAGTVSNSVYILLANLGMFILHGF